MNWNLVKGIFLDNLTLKLVALTLAFLLWVQIAGQQRVQRTIAVPVEFINMPMQLEITNDYPKEINLLVSKPSSVRMDDRQMAAVIDMSGTEAGTTVVPLTDRNIRNLPSGVDIESIEQRRLRLQLERVRRKIVSVEPEIVGQPADGYQVREVRLNPSEVLISGPESRLEKITTAETEAIDINGRSTSFRQSAYLDLEDPRLRIENASAVEVFVIIEEERREFSLTLNVRVLPQDVEARASPRRVEVTFSVPISYTEEIDRSRFEAFVTLQEPLEEEESRAVQPTVPIPEEYAGVVRIESIEPPTVQVGS